MQAVKEERNLVREIRDGLSRERDEPVTQLDLAEEIGCTERTIRRCENESRMPQKVFLRALVKLSKEAKVDLTGVLNVEAIAPRRKKKPVRKAVASTRKTLAGAK